METLQTWIAAFITLGLLSFAIGENPYYRLVEHLYVGIAAAHSLILGWENLQNNAFVPIAEDGEFLKIIPVVLGILLYARFIKGQLWLSRIPMSALVGIGVGLTVRSTITAEFLNQINATIVPLNSINNIIIVFGVVSVLMFFYFTRKDTNPVFNYTGTLGRYIMMIAFGALFGNAAMGRMSLMIGRLRFILIDWLNLGGGPV
ncbi:MAG: hypothetical protein ACLFPS_09370 [Clostridia bacterium]